MELKNLWQSSRQAFKTYISGGTDKHKKKKNSFYLKKFKQIKDEEEYWKKGKRKKIIYHYDLC
jgi:hypothetical protein